MCFFTCYELDAGSLQVLIGINASIMVLGSTRKDAIALAADVVV